MVAKGAVFVAGAMSEWLRRLIRITYIRLYQLGSPARVRVSVAPF
jgi:hypothetical protein